MCEPDVERARSARLEKGDGQSQLPQLEHVPVFQREQLIRGNLPPVDKGPVQATKVLNSKALCSMVNAGVLAGDAIDHAAVGGEIDVRTDVVRFVIAAEIQRRDRRQTDAVSVLGHDQGGSRQTALVLPSARCGQPA
jgi:hypothetical protein